MIHHVSLSILVIFVFFGPQLCQKIWSPWLLLFLIIEVHFLLNRLQNGQYTRLYDLAT
jgi:hypothetical protein